MLTKPLALEMYEASLRNILSTTEKFCREKEEELRRRMSYAIDYSVRFKIPTYCKLGFFLQAKCIHSKYIKEHFESLGFKTFFTANNEINLDWSHIKKEKK